MGFKVEWDDDIDDDEEVFDTYAEALEHVSVVQSDYAQGGEDLHLSNPGDYDEPGDDDELGFTIVEIYD
jgi:hypothetical protein